MNDFGDLAGHGRVALVERQLNTKFELEQRYKREILTALGKIFTLDRVQIVRLDIDLGSVGRDHPDRRALSDRHAGRRSAHGE